MKERYREILQVFLKLGFFAFGGPAAHIAMMEDEVVKKRQWISREKFVDLLGFTNLIPGPNSTEMAIHLGYIRGGKIGLLIAGVSFILPAMLIVLSLAVVYVGYGSLPAIAGILTVLSPSSWPSWYWRCIVWTKAYLKDGKHGSRLSPCLLFRFSALKKSPCCCLRGY